MIYLIAGRGNLPTYECHANDCDANDCYVNDSDANDFDDYDGVNDELPYNW